MTMISLHRSLRFFLLTTATLLLLVACGGENEDITPPSIKLDTEATPINSPTKDPHKVSFLPVQATVDDPNATVTLSTTPKSILVNDPPPVLTPPDVSFNLHDLEEGANTVTISATDSRGNMNSLSFSVTLDTVTPFLLLGPYSNLTSEPSVIIGGTAEAKATVEVTGVDAKPNSTPATGFTWEYTLTNLKDGLNTVTLTATDEAGNTTPPKEIDITFDSLAPPVTINPLNPSVQTPDVLLNGTAPDGTDLAITIAGSSPAPIPPPVGEKWQYTVSGLTKGDVTPITVTATDADSHVGTATVDLIYNTAPKITKTDPKVFETNVPVDQSITVYFDQQVIIVQSGFTVKNSSGELILLDPIAPPVYDAASNTWKVTVKPASNLIAGKTYIVTLLSSAITNTAGTKLVGTKDHPLSWSFTTSRQ